jgi:hypothetical protein
MREGSLECVLVASCVALASTACAARSRGLAHAPSRSQGDGKATSTPAWVSPPRLFVLPEEGGATYESVDKDGTRRFIALGMRVVERSDGRIQRAADLLPAANPARSVLLPERLGGGYLFYTAGPNGTLLWRADDWTSKLEPLGRLDLRAARVEAGFDRLYAMLEETGEVVALDPRSGQALDLGPLPASPTYRGLGFADAWLGAVDVPLRGLLVTFDAGASWRPSGFGSVSALETVDGRITINTPNSTLALDATGHLREARPASAVDPLFEDALSKLSSAAEAIDAATDKPPNLRAQSPGPLGRRPLRSAVLHGWPDTPSTAVVITRGTLGRVRLEDGKPLELKAGAVPAGETCHALGLGDGLGFMCGREGGGTTVYAFERPFGLRRVLSFREPRFVSASGNGALVVRGGCGPTERSQPGARAYCIRSRTGAVSEMLVRGDLGAERLVALSDERVAVLVPFRLGTPGLLTLVDRDRTSHTVKLELVGMDSPTRRLVRQGLWLDGFEQNSPDELKGWVVGADDFVGVRVGLDGKVRAGPPVDEPGRAMLSGRYALVVPRAGAAQETVDGGQSWQPAELPWDLEDNRARRAPEERGCGPVGCAMGAWIRVGWRGKRANTKPLAQAEAPRDTTLPAQGGGAWRLNCSPTGEATPAASRSSATKPYRASATPWEPFLGLPPPPRSSGDVGLDRGLENQDVPLHAYLWGTRGADWRTGGQWSVRVADRFAVNHAVWSTRPTRSPWPDEATAATAFGKSNYGSMASVWRATFEPSGKAAALTMGNDFFLLESGRSIVRVKDPTASGLTEAAGAVKLGDQWYVGGDGSSFRILRVEGEQMDLVGTYPLLGERQRRGMVSATLVRSRAGDALGIWVRSNKLRGSQSRWYVYPVDVATGTVDQPLEIGPTELGTFPPACGESDDGWLLEGSPPLPPLVVLPGGEAHVWRLEARLLASPTGLCVEALALATGAQADLTARIGRASDAEFRTSGKVPLALAAHADPEKRWGLRCTR